MVSLSNYYVPGTVLGAGDIAVEKIGFLPTWDVGLGETDKDTVHYSSIICAVKGGCRHRTLLFLKFCPPLASSNATHAIKPFLVS